MSFSLCTGAAASALLWIALAASAQTTIYKVQYPDGSIGFTDKPPANAKVIESREPGREVNVIPPPARPRTERSTSTSSSAGATLDDAHAEVLAAERALEDARTRKVAGKDPLPGERLGLSGGGTRLGPAYETRQQALDEAIAAAEARLKEAYAARNALR